VAEVELDGKTLLGLFELTDEGTVLYSSIESPEGGIQRHPNVDGTNFFTDVASFSNVNDLQRKFGLFCLNGARSTSFQFTCEYSQGPQPIRVVMARLMTDTGPTSFLLHFRKP
jgi:hypothetical protein